MNTVLVNNIRFPESPRWHGSRLWFSDYFTSQVMRVDQEGVVETVATLPDVPTALGWAGGGELLIVSAMERRLLRLEESGLVVAADLSGLVAHPCNDMVIDGQGRAYIGSMGFQFGDPDAVPAPGSILLVSPEGDARVVADGLAFPNGMVITPAGQTLIVAESYAACLTAFTIAPDGSLSGRRPWAHLRLPVTG